MLWFNFTLGFKVIFFVLNSLSYITIPQQHNLYDYEWTVRHQGKLNLI